MKKYLCLFLFTLIFSCNGLGKSNMDGNEFSIKKETESVKNNNNKPDIILDESIKLISKCSGVSEKDLHLNTIIQHWEEIDKEFKKLNSSKESSEFFKPATEYILSNISDKNVSNGDLLYEENGILYIQNVPYGKNLCIQKDLLLKSLAIFNKIGLKKEIYILLKDRRYFAESFVYSPPEKSSSKHQFLSNKLPFFYYAALLGHLDICELLLKNGANVDAKNFYARTLLHQATFKGDIELCKLLLSHRASVNEINGVGKTPLHSVASKGNVELCKLLLEHNASSDLTDAWGRVPRDLAEENGYQEIVDLFNTASHSE